MNRCTGQCCRDFVLPYSPMEIDRMNKFYLRTGRHKFQDWPIIGQMLIFLRMDQHNPNLIGSPTSEIYKYHYTCKHFDKSTGDCMIYDSRPRMCSGYPTYQDGRCLYKGCTYAV